MDSKVELYLKRSRTEINTAILLLRLSNNKQLHEFDIPEDETFYSGVISHCYYSIFYSVKAMLLTKGIERDEPEIHKKPFNDCQNARDHHQSIDWWLARFALVTR